MNAGKKAGPLLIFYLLVVYVLLQFGWWTWSMFHLNEEVAMLRTELNLLKGESQEQIISLGNAINERLRSKWLMISGEGTVFLALVMLGVMRIRKTFKTEILVAEQQKNFLLSVTHELKSPIASSKLLLQTLQKHDLSRIKQQEILSNAINDVNRLNNLVENILTATRIENNGYMLQKEKIDLSAYVNSGMRQTIETFGYSQKVILDIEPGLFITADKTTFASVVLNLFENAIKYSSSESTVTISLKKNMQSVILSVADEGKGIPDEDKKKIFQRFYRVGNEETRSAKGTGLGLYIARYFTEQHGGTLTVRDNHPKGSIFEAIFPASV